MIKYILQKLYITSDRTKTFLSPKSTSIPMEDGPEDQPGFTQMPSPKGEKDQTEEEEYKGGLIGILRHNADVNCAFVAKSCDDPFLLEVCVYAKRGKEVWEYDAIRKEYPRAMISSDFTTLCTETEDIFSSEQEFVLFRIDEAEYKYILDKDRFEGEVQHNAYFREVFMPWRVRNFNESVAEAKGVFEALKSPNASIDEDVLEAMRQYDVIVQMAEGFEPALFTTELNATDAIMGELAKYIRQPKRL